uniref:N-acetyltransferase domain-containing protein n=1 Tax=Chlorobium chlorochromatii (strain CaD3) TaxID=340177 RepID=Q3ASM0_CHLCH
MKLTFNDYTLETVYLHISDAQRLEVMDLWQTENAITSAAERERRSYEVVVMVRHVSGAVVGVSTVTVRTASNGKRYYYYRMFIHSSHRVPYLMRAVTNASRDFLATFRHPDGEVESFVVVTENPKLMRQGMRQLFERHGYTYKGKTSQGLDCWEYSFLQ